MKYNLEFLKEVLSIPTYTYEEDLMVEYLISWLDKNKFDYSLDTLGNIYVTKNTTGKVVENYPCVVAHTDTVHKIDSINIVEEYLPNYQKEEKLSLKAYNDMSKPTGIGGDNKCGVFACLQILKDLPVVKAAFFVSEETGCHGSKAADEKFFSNVGYVIQFDAPYNWMVTEVSMGVRLFERESEFHKRVDGILTEQMGEYKKYGSHPYTDVWPLKQKFDFACINISIGYYNYHSPQEYVVVEDTFKGVDTGKMMIEQLGYEKYDYKYVPKKFDGWF
jgi:putative aminopeptidase FrvX